VRPSFSASLAAARRELSPDPLRPSPVSYPTDTYAGFRALGFNNLIALMSAVAFHVLHVGYPTQRSWVPNPLFPVDIQRISCAKHGRSVRGCPRLPAERNGQN
jgi:peroxygenase